MSRRRAWHWVLAAAALSAGSVLVAPPAAAESPEIVREDIDETFPDDFLTEECGVPVETRAQGQVTGRFFPDDGTGLQFVGTINVTLTATSGDNSVSFKDVGADVVRIEPDGTAVLSITGQVPFFFTGVLKIDLGTGDVIHEPQHFTDTTRVCAILTA